MKITIRGFILGVFLGALSLTAYAAEDAKAPVYSGFLGADSVYAQLTDVKLPDGAKSKRWIGPDLSAANYTAVVIDPVTLYPKPEPGPQVDSDTLDQISSYLNDQLRDKVAAKIKVVDKAGPGVARLQVAVTGVAVSKEGLKPRDVIPVAAVFHILKAASDTSNMDVLVYVEARVVDSQSNALLGAGMRQLHGDDLHGDKQQLKLKDVSKSLDEATDDAASSISSALATN